MKHEVLYVNMLGKFSISYGDKQISCDNNRSKQLWSILAYLIYNRGKANNPSYKGHTTVAFGEGEHELEYTEKTKTVVYSFEIAE